MNYKNTTVLILILALSLHQVAAVGIAIPDFLVQVFVNFEDALSPWFETFFFIVNYPFLWLTCYTQAYFFYSDFGGDQIFLICKEKTYDTY